jgi:hypothetical protein
VQIGVAGNVGAPPAGTAAVTVEPALRRRDLESRTEHSAVDRDTLGAMAAV